MRRLPWLRFLAKGGGRRGPVGCYELRHATVTPPLRMPDFESVIITRPCRRQPCGWEKHSANARAARWLVWKYTRETEESIIVARRRLDEIEGRDP